MTSEQPMPVPDYRFSVAPMMDWTTSEFRVFARLLSRRALLYTEMITTGALLYGDKERFLGFDEVEHPVALQLGGSDPGELAQCARFAEQAGYDEVNLNVGCPSDRVQNNRIGACLMAEPETVANAVKAMRDRVSIPVTVKHRIGIDGRESYQELCDFMGAAAEAGCQRFIVHARIAVLSGLSPKENREIPPLNYAWVHQLKRDFPHLAIILNGGLKSIQECQAHLSGSGLTGSRLTGSRLTGSRLTGSHQPGLDGVMLGREAYQNPWIMAQVDTLLYDQPSPVRTRHEAIERFIPYVQQQLSNGKPLNRVTRHILGLFHGQPGGRQFRRHLSENAHLPGANSDVLKAALERTQAPQAGAVTA